MSVKPDILSIPIIMAGLNSNTAKDPQLAKMEADLGTCQKLRLNRGGKVKEVDAAALRKPHARTFGRDFQHHEHVGNGNAGGLLRNDGHRPGN